FMNRLDSIVVFHPLKRTELDEVLNIELERVQRRVMEATTIPFAFRMTDEGREVLLEEGTDQRDGARHPERAIEHLVVCPLARLLTTAQVGAGDVLLIDRHPGQKGLAFVKDREGRLPHRRMPFASLSQRATAQAA